MLNVPWLRTFYVDTDVLKDLKDILQYKTKKPYRTVFVKLSDTVYIKIDTA